MQHANTDKNGKRAVKTAPFYIQNGIDAEVDPEKRGAVSRFRLGWSHTGAPNTP